MARAKRHYIPGQIWHLTHRCHKREFLLKLVKDRKRWLHWLFEAKRRYGLIILNYTVTSNHIHLLVQDKKRKNVIPESIKLVAGRTGQEYNIRKKRKGAFWEDRYHATAIENAHHLLKCLAYIDLNMVRNGVVSHPCEWQFGGYNEIQNPRKKYVLINYERLTKLAGFKHYEELQKVHKEMIEESLINEDNARQTQWTESVAVGSKSFTEKIKEKMGIKAKGRQIIETHDDEAFQLRETSVSYSAVFNSRKEDVEQKNTYFWL
jgi:putative transposase